MKETVSGGGRGALIDTAVFVVAVLFTIYWSFTASRALAVAEMCAASTTLVA